MKLYILVVATVIISFKCYAAGVITLKGKVRSFDPKQLVVLSKSNIYYIDRSKFRELNKEKTKSLKFNQNITLTVPFGAVTKVKHLSKNKTSK